MNYLNRVLFMILIASATSGAFAQKKNQPITTKQKRWQHLDPLKDSVYGISMDRAYQELLKGRKKKTVIVAVIDSGVDTLHEDLKPVLWHNIKEKGSDEDHNGYRNDKLGWNFLGTKEKNITLRPGLEYLRVYLSQKNECGSHTDGNILSQGSDKCRAWLSAKEKFKKDSTATISQNLEFWEQIIQEDSMWRKALGKEIYTTRDLKQQVKQAGTDKTYRYLPQFLSQDSTRTNQEQLILFEDAKARLFRRYSQDPVAYRAETIGDNYNNFSDRYYGTPLVSTGTADVNHGTHVAGIIAAKRNNGVGSDGIADAVNIMSIRAVPAGADEYDKDVALAIRYAVDNGAKVINMSFGKAYSPQRKWVEDAILYAASKDVLLVHAAGNDGVNIDSVINYPTALLQNGNHATNVITVGASGSTREQIIGSFSNYGRRGVDLFAPGVQIYSTAFDNEGSKYAIYDGTSMASPTVAGVAAVVRSSYPKLSALQVKDIIEKSVTKIDGYVTQPGAAKKQVLMTDLCKSGGIVNAYEALRLAKKCASRKKKK